MYQSNFRIVCYFNARRRLMKTREAMWWIRRPYSVVLFVSSMVGRTNGTPRRVVATVVMASVMASRVDTPCWRASAWTDTGIVFMKPLGSTTDVWVRAVRPWAIEVTPRLTIAGRYKCRRRVRESGRESRQAQKSTSRRALQPHVQHHERTREFVW